jgi:hypothetical protein
VVWIAESSPGADDETVLVSALTDGRVLLTFDKDFGEMAFRQGKTAACGIVLFRPRIRSPAYVMAFVASVLTQAVSWDGNFSVAQEGKLRVVPLPERPMAEKGKRKKRRK